MRERLKNTWMSVRIVAASTSRQFVEHTRGVIFTLALAALSYGCAIERESLGYIVPGGLVVGLFVIQKVIHLRGPRRD